MTVELIDEVHDRVHRYIAGNVAAKRARAAVAEEHAAIIDALDAGDTELARARLRDHIMRTARSVRIRQP